MRNIELGAVSEKIRELFIEACENIPENVYAVISKARDNEKSPLGGACL